MSVPTPTLSAANVRVAGTGRILVAAAGTALPTGSQATPNAAFHELGLISSDGVTESQGNSTNKVTAWQGADTVRVVQTEHDLTYKFTAIETNPIVLQHFYGNESGGVVEINALLQKIKPWIIDAIDGDDMIRIVVPYAQVTERGDRKFQSGDAIGYDFTITAYPDPAYSGSQAASAKAYQYLYDVSGADSA